MYVVKVTSPAGCSSTDTVTVTMLAPITATAGPAVSICRRDSVRLGAAPVLGQKYAWSPRKGLNDSTLSNPMASPDSTVTYTLTVTGSGCTPGTDKVTVTVNQIPIVNVGPDDTIGAGTSVQLNANGGVQYLWTPSSGLSNASIANPVASPDTSTTYIVTVTNIFGCSNSDTITVHVITNAVWAPTAFTPNGDGNDDIFYIHGSGIKNFEMGVYNRWGEEIFHSQDINMGWDGRRQVTREEMPDGAYIYYVRGTLPDGTSINTKGMINLIR
jgi:gliding motility-associated-like protein